MITYLDLKKINKLCDEIGRDSLPALLDIFINELAGYRTDLLQENDDLGCYIGEISHVLKSSAASFGAQNLCKLAIEIDEKVKAGESVSLIEYRDAMLSSIQGTILAYNSLA